MNNDNGKKQFTRLYNLFFEPGDVVEIRALGITGKDKAWGMEFARQGGVIFGYFDNADKFATAAHALSKKQSTAVYFTLNPVKKGCLARAVNRLKPFNKHAEDKQTGDEDIRCIRWLLIDLDPVREDGVKNIPTTNDELARAKDLGKRITDGLAEKYGFPGWFGGLSGNGYHIYYRLPDLDNTKEISKKYGLVHRMLLAIEKQFSDPDVIVDTTVYSAAQLGRVYGTMNRRGDHTDERPHRLSKLFKNVPEKLADVPALSQEAIERLAADAPADTIQPTPTAPPAPPGRSSPPAPPKTKKLANQLGELKMDEYLAHYGVDVHEVKQEGGRTIYKLKRCLFNEEHQNGDAGLITLPTAPYLAYHCFHNSCSGYKWEDARQAISGNDKIARFYTNFDPNWKSKKEPGSGVLSRIEIEDVAVDVPPPPEGLQHPMAIDPMEFHVLGGKSKRPTFLEIRMVDYLAAYLAPIRHTSGIFYKYTNGLWKPFPEGTINKMVLLAMGDRHKAAYIDAVKKGLAAKINMEEECWPQNTGLVNVKNGMVDIPKAQLIPHDPKYGSRAQLAVPYNIDCTWDRFAKHLFEVFPEKDGVGDAKRELLQQFAGYCLINTCRYEKALFAVGTGGNGKSTIFDSMDRVIGLENISSLSLDELGYRFNIPYMMNKLVNHAGEMDPKVQVDTKTLKAAISGERVSGEFKHGKRIEFYNTAKFIFSMNATPGITEKTKGISRRLLVLYFNREFEDDPNKDAHLKEYLWNNELPGILTWMLIGAEKVLRNDGFYLTEEMEQDRMRFLRSMNPVMLFVEERCELDPDALIPCQELFDAYVYWIEQSKHKSLGRTNFYEQILQHWNTKRDKFTFPDGSRRHGFQGIALRGY